MNGTADGYLNVQGDYVKTVMTSANVGISGYEFDSEGWCFIIELIAEILESMIEDMLEEFMEEYLLYDLPIVVDDALVSLTMDESFDVWGNSINVEINPSSVPIDSEGGTIVMEGAISTKQDMLCVPYFDGSRYTPSDLPSYGPDVPELPGTPYDVALSLSDDLFNQAVFSMFDTGLFCLMLDHHSAEKYGFEFSITTDDLKLFLPELYDLAPDAPFALALNPQEPFYVTIGTGGGLVEGQFDLVINNLHLDGYIELHERYVRAFSANTSLSAEVLVQVTEQNTLKLYITEIPDATVDLLWEELVDINDEMFEVVVPFLLEIVLPVILHIMDDFELPSFEGYAIVPLAIVADGPSMDYLSIYGDLAEGASAGYNGEKYRLRRKQQQTAVIE